MTGPGSRWGAMNLPDDWGMYFTRCSRCGARYHLSESGCDAAAEQAAELRAEAREDRRRDEEGR